MARSHLVVIGDREALAWILEARRMAFPSYREREVSALAPGDEMLLYTTRTCFHNPTRDRGRIIGIARASTAPERLVEPVKVAGREFGIGCEFELEALTPLGHGVELAPLIGSLETFSGGGAWAIRLRRPLLTLKGGDEKLILRQLRPRIADLEDSMRQYVEAATPRDLRRSHRASTSLRR